MATHMMTWLISTSHGVATISSRAIPTEPDLTPGRSSGSNDPTGPTTA